MSKQDPKMNLTEGPIARKLLLFSLPVLYGNVLQSLNGTVNSIWVGKFLGESAFAATSNANNVMFLMLSSIFGIGMASTIMIGQSIGSGDIRQAKRVVGTSTLFFFTLSMFVAAAGFFLSPQILGWMNTPPDAIEMANAYLRIIFMSMPFMFCFSLIMTILRGAGDSKTPFKFLVMAIILDIVLNPLLIFGWGPIPAFHISGSALATAISQLVALAAILLSLYRKKHFLRITRDDRRLLRYDREIIGSLVKKGVPMGLQMIVVSTSALAMINLVNRFGSEATAAFGAAMQLSSYIQMPAMAIGGAVSSFAAQNVGAGKWDRVHRVTWLGVVFNFVMTGVLVVLIYLFNRQALGLFLPEGRAIEIGMTINTITLWSFVIFGITFVVSGVVRSTGAVMVPLLITFLALWCMRIPLSYYLADSYGLDAVWWSFPIGFTAGSLLSVAYYFWGNWKKASMLTYGAPKS
ncbi:MATE family efflux transporter [Paenibacillus lutrae]|uniref:MATE family efflux transporter n=1 Tax=Paenibacillus lutrae TaxID=2078573 RepID=A0A7X3FG63_9BACL|nr:MATE family efflux transporter [Paenibacillus lutrae]MVO99039.1 MATE family efflux transporter [Paenibacillus lutrae]